MLKPVNDSLYEYISQIITHLKSVPWMNITNLSQIAESHVNFYLLGYWDLWLGFNVVTSGDAKKRTDF